MTRRDWARIAREDRIRAGLALHLIAAATGVPTEAMTSGGRMSQSACRARWLALYLASMALGWPLDRTSRAFEVNRATVINACRWCEDRRDEPAMDRLLEDLTETLARVCCAARPDLKDRAA